jgi:hypothetical protein
MMVHNIDELKEERLEVKREIEKRQYVYPRMVSEGRMSEKQQEKKIAVMKRLQKRLEDMIEDAKQPSLFESERGSGC